MVNEVFPVMTFDKHPCSWHLLIYSHVLIVPKHGGNTLGAKLPKPRFTHFSFSEVHAYMFELKIYSAVFTCGKIKSRTCSFICLGSLSCLKFFKEIFWTNPSCKLKILLAGGLQETAIYFVVCFCFVWWRGWPFNPSKCGRVADSQKTRIHFFSSRFIVATETRDLAVVQQEYLDRVVVSRCCWTMRWGWWLQK